MEKKNEILIKRLPLGKLILISGSVCAIAMLLKHNFNVISAIPEFLYMWIGMTIVSFFTQKYILFHGTTSDEKIIRRHKK